MKDNIIQTWAKHLQKTLSKMIQNIFVAAQFHGNTHIFLRTYSKIYLLLSQGRCTLGIQKLLGRNDREAKKNAHGESATQCSLSHIYLSVFLRWNIKEKTGNLWRKSVCHSV